MPRSFFSMPSPVLALPCGSKSTISTRFLVAASAVARLIAVVVLPTPPFWLAMARMRGAALGAPSVATAHFGEMQDHAGRIGHALDAVDGELPILARLGQFFLRAAALEEETVRRGGEELFDQG